MIKAILFDVDGTLLDSFEANLAFIGELMKATRYPAITREEYFPRFHKPLREILETLYGISDIKEINRILDFARAHGELKRRRPILANGAEETMRALHKEYPLGIVTSRIKTHA